MTNTCSFTLPPKNLDLRPRVLSFLHSPSPCPRNSMTHLAGSRIILGFLVLATICSATSIHQRQYSPYPTTIPTPEECIDISLTRPSWRIYGSTLVVVNSSSGGTQGDVRVPMVNLATGLWANCTAEDIELDPKEPEALSIWHNCSFPDLYFQFNLSSLEMRAKGSWTCDNSSRLVIKSVSLQYRTLGNGTNYA